MLQRQSFQEQLPDDTQGETLSLSNFIELLKRRWLLFTIPFAVFLALGTMIAFTWPATYLSEGKLLVESPQIPSDLVRPTVAVVANERVQIIEQRIMTRDNLLAIAKKFALSIGWQGRLSLSWQGQGSGTELVDFIRQRTQIKPLELQNPRRDVQAIAFTVGFNYEDPSTAQKVANELMTMILSEDVRGRTNSATETTRFLAQEVKRLEGQISAIDTQIAKVRELRAADAGDLSTDATQMDDTKRLASLKAELLMKTATLSEEHPDVKSLKRAIASLTKSIASAKDSEGVAPKTSGPGKGNSNTDVPPKPNTGVGTLDSLLTQKVNLNNELTGVTQKLAAARLGESLERGQFAERLQVIEQPTMPDRPASPNRPKIFGFAAVLALIASGGLVFAAELLNPAIQRSSDLFSVIDSHLIVTIPYITTSGEIRRKKKRTLFMTGALALVVVAGVIAILFVLPPLDVLWAKLVARFFG
jgi:capsular polysaccharide biosynthesis protein